LVCDFEPGATTAPVTGPVTVGAGHGSGLG
jgi:hypothetical protein